MSDELTSQDEQVVGRYRFDSCLAGRVATSEPGETITREWTFPPTPAATPSIWVSEEPVQLETRTGFSGYVRLSTVITGRQYLLLIRQDHFLDMLEPYLNATVARMTDGMQQEIDRLGSALTAEQERVALLESRRRE